MVLAPREIAEASVGYVVEIIVDRIALGAQAILDSVLLEVGLDTPERKLRMECGQDETASTT